MRNSNRCSCRRFSLASWRLRVGSVVGCAFVLFLALNLALAPGLVQAAMAADTDAPAAAPPAQVQTLRQLAKGGYLGDKKDSTLAASSMTEDEATDLVIQAGNSLAEVDVKELKPGSYRLEDLRALLGLVKAKSEDILARKVSAWKFENKVKRMIAALSPDPTPGPEKTEAQPSPVPTLTPVPAPSLADFNALRADERDLVEKLADLQAAYDKKVDALQKDDVDLQASNGIIKSAQSDNQDQLNLVKKLLDRVQYDLKQSQDQLALVSKKADEKSISDTELQQELDIMHKDLRDNTQDVSVLKQEVAQLNQVSSTDGESPIDSLLGSKWVSGGALLLGVTALVVALTKK